MGAVPHDERASHRLGKAETESRSATRRPYAITFSPFGTELEPTSVPPPEERAVDRLDSGRPREPLFLEKTEEVMPRRSDVMSVGIQDGFSVPPSLGVPG